MEQQLFALVAHSRCCDWAVKDRGPKSSWSCLHFSSARAATRRLAEVLSYSSIQSSYSFPVSSLEQPDPDSNENNCIGERWIRSQPSALLAMWRSSLTLAARCSRWPVSCIDLHRGAWLKMCSYSPLLKLWVFSQACRYPELLLQARQAQNHFLQQNRNSWISLIVAEHWRRKYRRLFLFWRWKRWRTHLRAHLQSHLRKKGTRNSIDESTRSGSFREEWENTERLIGFQRGSIAWEADLQSVFYPWSSRNFVSKM